MAEGIAVAPVQPQDDQSAAVGKELADVTREHLREENAALGQLSGGGAMRDVQRAYHAEGASLNDPALRPWNEKAEQAHFQTDPIQAFGSIGSVFGIIASAFTHAPMQNALNASAAAMNAIKQGDRQAYEDARKAWEDNYKLALERHKIQHEQYQDAVELLKTNMAAGEAKLRVLAAKFSDQKALVLLDHGMVPEVLEMQAAREKLNAAALQNQKVLMGHLVDQSLLFSAGYNPKLPADSPENMEAAKKYEEMKAQFKREGSPFAARGGIVTTDRAIAQGVEAEVQQYKQEHPNATQPELDDFRAQRTQELKQKSAPITANRADEIRGKIGQVDQATKLVDHIEEMLKKHNAITGLGGKVTRPGEIVSNIFGSDSTDRVQFERWVEELQMLAPRILLDAKGRPLTAEAGEVNSIIAGLRAGDTTANTARAYYEFRKVLNDIKGRLGERMGGGAKPEAPAASSQGDNWWESAPAVHNDQHSEDMTLPPNAKPAQYKNQTWDERAGYLHRDIFLGSEMPSSLNLDYYKSLLYLAPNEDLAGGRRDEAFANVEMLKRMPPQQQLAWYMKVLGPPPQKQGKAMENYNRDIIPKVLAALANGTYLPKVPMSH